MKRIFGSEDVHVGSSRRVGTLSPYYHRPKHVADEEKTEGEKEDHKAEKEDKEWW